MRLFECCFSAVILCTLYWQDSAAKSNLTKVVVEIANNPKGNDLNKTRPLEFVSIKKLIPRNLNKEKGNVKKSELNEGSTPDSGPKPKDTENGTLDLFKSLFLFPIRPPVLPLKDESFAPKTDGAANDTSSGPKPFIFFDFAFNIRQIPLKNDTNQQNDSKIIQVKRLPVESKNSKERNRRNAEKEEPEFFEDAPLFTDPELDEFFPKPDLFFTDLSFRPKPAKKLSRKKRDEKKLDAKNDVKFFRDVFDEVFERTDPLLNIIKSIENSFEEKKDGDDFFNRMFDEQDNPKMRWNVQREVKKLDESHADESPKSPQSPVIILDKFTNVGEFRFHDDKTHGQNPKMMKIKKKDVADLNRKSIRDERTDKDEIEPVGSVNRKQWKRNHHAGTKKKEQIFTSTDVKEISVLPQVNTSYVSFSTNGTVDTGSEHRKSGTNDTEKALKYKNLLNAIDSIRSALKTDFVDTVGKFKRSEPSEGGDTRPPKKTSYDDLQKNISEVLNQFLTLVANEEEESPRDGLQDVDEFTWSEKEMLNALGARRKKEAEFPAEYVDASEKSERKVANLNFLFLTVTLPTVLVFSFVLLVCFFSLRVKGKLCARLFKPRQVYILEDEVSSASKPLKKAGKADNI